VKLSEQAVQLLSKDDESGEWDLVTQFPREDFPGFPVAVRVGKLGPSWSPRDHGERGTTNPCRVEWVRQYE